jgi:hypothetical protein
MHGHKNVKLVRMSADTNVHGDDRTFHSRQPTNKMHNIIPQIFNNIALNILKSFDLQVTTIKGTRPKQCRTKPN